MWYSLIPVLQLEVLFKKKILIPSILLQYSVSEAPLILVKLAYNKNTESGPLFQAHRFLCIEEILHPPFLYRASRIKFVHGHL